MSSNLFLMTCQKENCNNPKIPRGKYCEEHRTNKGSLCEHKVNKYHCKK